MTPDICMCRDDTCPKRGGCYRYRAEPYKHWQSYFVSSPRDGDDCKRYWRMDNGYPTDSDTRKSDAT